MESCVKHPHERGQALCRRCGGAWCQDCLVFSFGPKKPPYCMSCAMVAGGVRTSGARPPMAKSELRARAKAVRAEAKADAKAARSAKDPVPASVSFDPTPAAAETDWSTPWWEDRQPTLAD